MKNILFINDLDDISNKKITHFSLDKALFLASGMAEQNKHLNIYFLTTGKQYIENNIVYTNIDTIDASFLENTDLIIIVREGILPNIIDGIPALKIFLKNPKKCGTKIMIKSDSVQWMINKSYMTFVSDTFGVGLAQKNIVDWTINHFDYICVQTPEFENDAIKLGIPKNKLLVLNMAVPNNVSCINFDDLENPYDISYSYCVNDIANLGESRALLPIYYCNNNKINQKEKKIIVYMGRIKTDNGKIFYTMKDIMKKLGEEYELHIFPGSFTIPDFTGDSHLSCSARNSNHLDMLRKNIFSESKNVIIHYPCQHRDIYKYLHYAYCGIDFSEMRPQQKSESKAGHAKILEYCSAGLPIVCEENINNLFLIRNAGNGIILPYMASSDEYAKAITSINGNFTERKKYRDITFKNENSILRANQLLQLL